MFGADKTMLEGMKKQLCEQRWADFEDGQLQYIPTFPETPYPDTASLPEKDPLSNEWDRFYAVPRGHHPNARGGFTTTSNLAFLNFRLLDFIDEISPRPILFITGDKAHSKPFSEKAYALANEPKELFVVPDAEHIDLYYRVDRIPFDKLESFFKDNM